MLNMNVVDVIPVDAQVNVTRNAKFLGSNLFMQSINSCLPVEFIASSLG